MTDRPNNQDAGIKESWHLSDDELSAYLDQDFADLAARERLGAHLKVCAECRERLAELRTIVHGLRVLEHPVPKRSFHLDASQVQRPLPEPVRIDPWIVRAQPVLRRLTAIAAVLLVLLVTADLVTHRNSPESGTQVASALSSASQASGGSSAGAAESTPASSNPAVAASVATVESSSGGSGVSGGYSAESTASSADATAASAAADSAKAGDETTPAATAAALALQRTEASGEAPAAAAPTVSPPAHGGPSTWRLVELGVGIVVVWLLVLSVALPRMLRQRHW